jgi:hypothetical protein
MKQNGTWRQYQLNINQRVATDMAPTVGQFANNFGSALGTNLVNKGPELILLAVPELRVGEGYVLAMRGSTSARTITTIEEQAIRQAAAHPTAGRVIDLTMNDSRWPASEGWVKMFQDIGDVQVHYVFNRLAKLVDDFKP